MTICHQNIISFVSVRDIQCFLSIYDSTIDFLFVKLYMFFMAMPELLKQFATLKRVYHVSILYNNQPYLNGQMQLSCNCVLFISHESTISYYTA